MLSRLHTKAEIVYASLIWSWDEIWDMPQNERRAMSQSETLRSQGVLYLTNINLVWLNIYWQKYEIHKICCLIISQSSKLPLLANQTNQTGIRYAFAYLQLLRHHIAPPFWDILLFSIIFLVRYLSHPCHVSIFEIWHEWDKFQNFQLKPWPFVWYSWKSSENAERLGETNEIFIFSNFASPH
jgi:hypothetical protein